MYQLKDRGTARGVKTVEDVSTVNSRWLPRAFFFLKDSNINLVVAGR